MSLTIPLLVPQRVVEWAVRKGFIEFEYDGTAQVEEPVDQETNGVEENEAGVHAAAQVTIERTRRSTLRSSAPPPPGQSLSSATSQGPSSTPPSTPSAVIPRAGLTSPLTIEAFQDATQTAAQAHFSEHFADALRRRLEEMENEREICEQEHKRQISQLSCELEAALLRLERVTRHLKESQEYNTFLESELEAAKATITVAASELQHFKNKSLATPTSQSSLYSPALVPSFFCSSVSPPNPPGAEFILVAPSSDSHEIATNSQTGKVAACASGTAMQHGADTQQNPTTLGAMQRDDIIRRRDQEQLWLLGGQVQPIACARVQKDAAREQSASIWERLGEEAATCLFTRLPCISQQASEESISNPGGLATGAACRVMEVTELDLAKEVEVREVDMLDAVEEGHGHVEKELLKWMHQHLEACSPPSETILGEHGVYHQVTHTQKLDELTASSLEKGIDPPRTPKASSKAKGLTPGRGPKGGDWKARVPFRSLQQVACMPCNAGHNLISL